MPWKNVCYLRQGGSVLAAVCFVLTPVELINTRIEDDLFLLAIQEINLFAICIDFANLSSRSW